MDCEVQEEKEVFKESLDHLVMLDHLVRQVQKVEWENQVHLDHEVN